ncbi:prolyl oligopeptidase family serine peptidase [Halomonas korlensis]|uniref:Esterase PHB depolymerase n=1 Tax=Halomonas korlensis TaxID=463301 RepID=A0A1I7K6Y6_9GAMM|nr:Esterase PHB depolymerase [Halomonas korlensis]
MRLLQSSLVSLALVGLALPSAAQESPPDLPGLAIDTEDVSLVGVSSGGYMATQLAVAWPERFVGLGMLGTGPWACAQGSLSLALGQCMSNRLGLPDLDQLSQRLQDYRRRDLVGDADELADLRVFVWHGEEDETVLPQLGDALVTQFKNWLADPEDQLRLVVSDDAGHGWPVAARGNTPITALADCREGGGTYLLGCDLDIAGRMMNWLHGGLTRPTSGEPEGQLLRFDQTEFDTKGFADSGYSFIPEACQGGGCGLTVALHGCGMGAEQIDEAFVRHSGLNEWAAANQRVVLYPQAETSLPNPQGCWDWWGFAESTWQLNPLHDSREGTQLSGLMAMIDRLQQTPKR